MGYVSRRKPSEPRLGYCTYEENCGVDHACNPPRDWARFFFYTCVSLHPMEVDYNPCLSAMCHVDEAERPLPHGFMTPQ